VLRLTRAQVRAVDRIAIEVYQIPGILLMENAARGFTDELFRSLPLAVLAHPLILCGGGNNGGDGLAIARHLHNRGCDVTIALTIDPTRYTGDALINWRITQAMRLRTTTATPEFIGTSPATLLIDAIFGTGLTTAPRAETHEVIEAINRSDKPTIAVDLPSGLDCDTGQPLGPCVRATRTITFAAEKTGFTASGAAHWLGPVTLVDIGCPPETIAMAIRATPS
jgi:NAD(P)H-hydrate epimerase